MIETFDDELKSAVLRTIISRAYYSVFLELISFLKLNTDYYCPYGENEHKFVLDFIMDNQIFDFNSNIQISRTLKSLRLYRNKCDYSFKKPNSFKNYNLSIDEILDDCNIIFDVLK